MKNVSQIVRVLAAVVIGATFISSLAHAQQTNPNKLPTCIGDYHKNRPWNNCWGEYRVRLSNVETGEAYTGEFLNHRYDGFGIHIDVFGNRYVGNFRNGYFHGPGILTFRNGEQQDGIWENEKLIRKAKVNLPAINNNIATNNDRTDIDRERQQTNPNKLRPCPNPDYSKNSDIGIGGRTEKWTNCWGRYTVEVATTHKGDVLEGECLNGWLHGQGTYTFANGDKYVGEWKDGKRNGQGTLTFANGNKYVGEYKDGEMNGLGMLTVTDGGWYYGEWQNNKPQGQGIKFYSRSGERKEGIWENNNFIREAKVNLPAINNNTATNTDRTDIDRKRQHLAEERRRLEENKRQHEQAKYVGEYKDGKKSGQGTHTFANGDKYVGEFWDDMYNGQGVFTFVNGDQQEGIWENNKFIHEVKVNLQNLNNDTAINTDRSDIDRERQQLAEERRRLEEERRQQDRQTATVHESQRQQLAEERRRLEEDKRQHEQAKSSQRINLQVTHTQPTSDGSFLIEVKTNADTASLKIDGKEEGGKADGNYSIKRIARAGQASSFKIIATDVYGNTDIKSITISRTIVDSKVTYVALNPAQVRQQSTRDAVAIIIGIADYKSLPKADFANDDARAFYDYAIRALGIKPENIKLLVDSDAEEVEIMRTFRNWLPSKVRSTTDVYVFYSGHGLPTADGQGLYLIPPRAARDLIDDTAIPFSKINAALQSAKPKSVTMILDACYSGQARSGETLVASARPVQLKTENRLFPENFTVITASQNDQISSSNPDLQHGIFSYYLMKGMEGEADANRDGKITLGEMQAYLVENVGRQAGMMNRKQEPQLVGDANRVLVGR
jgi:hypothetical protein